MGKIDRAKCPNYGNLGEKSCERSLPTHLSNLFDASKTGQNARNEEISRKNTLK